MFLLRTPGNKSGVSPKGQTPDDAAARRHGPSRDANSSVSDLANSVTSDMLMVTSFLQLNYLEAMRVTHYTVHHWGEWRMTREGINWMSAVLNGKTHATSLTKRTSPWWQDLKMMK